MRIGNMYSHEFLDSALSWWDISTDLTLRDKAASPWRGLG
jgi:hypothetical protein